MKHEVLAKRYAKALFEYALENKAEEEVLNDLDKIQTILDENRDVQLLLVSPIITASKKQKVFELIFKQTISPITHTFLDILIRKGRGQEILNIATQYRSFHLDHNGIVAVELTTAQQITDEMQARILESVKELTDKKLLVEHIIDPELIGGFKIRLNDYLIDASISKTLERLQKEFEKNLYIYK